MATAAGAAAASPVVAGLDLAAAAVIVAGLDLTAAVIVTGLDLAATAVVVADVMTAVVSAGVQAAGTRVLAAGARVVDAIVVDLAVIAPRSGGLTGAARIVGVLGLVARTRDVLVPVRRVVVTAITGRVVLRRLSAIGGRLGGGRRASGCRIVRTLGSHDNRREDPEERDSKDECECSTHDHKARAEVVSGFPSAGQGWVRAR
jgi:hypothetical protein